MDVEETASTVLRVSSRVVGQPVDAGQSFFAAGGDSLLAVELIIALERELGVEVEEDWVFSADSLGQLAERIAAASDRPSR
ncbi:hypothetical protein I0C86_14220 [Plantactinospora sp. S1510]|uniref:Carrier domain-containing protein n=1 Tax=Plantactinospora alkalitolerans TaxID=2789879 RepID=A0ABS0GV99_9ACTN|nr:phosphopantetheine-binding protein [Plantactinospora alkalitolerans]MBF9130105.1 hypothetical protein [Plantactinospora alkalitolerans]